MAANADQRPRIVEHFLAQQVAGVFGIDVSEVDTTIPITNLGLDSLMAVELINRIESATAATLPMSGILNGPSVRELSKTVLELIDLGDEEADNSIESDSLVEAGAEVDFSGDAQLDPQIVPSGDPVHVTSGSRVFLTGATGFLGAQLLAELLAESDAEFVCLVRAEDETSGMRRIRDNIEAYGLQASGLEDRVKVVAGDFSKPLLGLSEEGFERLASEIDVIYHNGADVNLLSPYPVLRSANVLGTQEVLRLACYKKTKPLHFVSTFTVLSTEASRGQKVTETDPLPACEELLYGYSQTKWVSEKLVEVAESRGLPVTIYRPGHITGDSLTGAANVNDLLHTIILACLRLGAAPMRNVQLDLTPVDYVAKAIAHLSRQPESVGKIFHLTNPQPLTTEAVLEWMKDSGAQVDLMRYEQWRERLTDLADEHHASVDQFQLLTDVLIPRVSGENDRGVHPSFDCSDALNGLAGSGISCPPANEKLLAVGHEYLQRAGVVPQQVN